MNISNLKFVIDANNLLQYEVDGEINFIPFSVIREFWVYATSEDFEGGSAYVSDSYIVGFITVASGQGGIVFVWNALSHKIVHISEGAYTISVLLLRDKVYSLCYVTNYVTPAHFVLCITEFGLMDVDTEATVVEFDCSFSVEKFDGNCDSVKLISDADGLYLSADDQKYPILIKQEN